MEEAANTIKKLVKRIGKFFAKVVLTPTLATTIIIVLIAGSAYFILQWIAESVNKAATAYTANVTINEDGTISTEMSALELWNQMKKAGYDVDKYLKNSTELEKLMNAEIVTQLPDTRSDVTKEIDWDAIYKSESANQNNSKDKINVLFVGNSKTFVNELPTQFQNLAQSLGKEVYAVRTTETWGGRTLNAFLDEDGPSQDFKNRVSETKWDYVVLQEQTDASLDRDQLTQGASRIINYVKENSNKYVIPIYDAWSVLNDFNAIDYNSATSNYEAAKSQNGGEVAYIAKALLECHSKYPSMNLFSDLVHPTTEGTYLAACCTYGAIYGGATKGASFKFGLSDEVATNIQEVADEVQKSSSSNKSIQGIIKFKRHDENGNEFYITYATPTEFQNQVEIYNKANDKNASDAAKEFVLHHYTLKEKPRTSTATTINGTGSFAKYNLTDDKLYTLAQICTREQGDAKGAAAEASLMANLFELAGSSFGQGADGLYNYVMTSGWFGIPGNRNIPSSIDDENLQAVKAVLVQGYRTLPKYVNEHDCINPPDIINPPSRREDFIPFQTVLNNIYGSTYTFYSFPTEVSDPFGYTSEENRQKYGDFCYEYGTWKPINGEEDKNATDVKATSSSRTSTTNSNYTGQLDSSQTGKGYQAVIGTWTEVQRTVDSDGPNVDAAANSLGIDMNTSPTYTMSTTTINYEEAVQPYTLTFDLLWSLLVIGQSKGFVMDLADLAYNSEIEVSVYDNLTTITDKDNYTYKEPTNAAVSGRVSYNSNDAWNVRKVEQIEKHEHKYPDAYVNPVPSGHIYKSVITYNNTVSFALTKAHTWIVDYDLEYKYNNDMGTDHSEVNQLPDQTYIYGSQSGWGEDSCEVVQQAIDKVVSEANADYQDLAKSKSDKINQTLQRMIGKAIDAADHKLQPVTITPPSISSADVDTSKIFVKTWVDRVDINQTTYDRTDTKKYTALVPKLILKDNKTDSKTTNQQNKNIVAVAEKLWKEQVWHSGKDYGGSNVPCTGSTIDCSSFVSWILYEYGYDEFAGDQHYTQQFYLTDWNAKYGWYEIPLVGGQNPINDLQPGDIIVRDPGNNDGHVTFVAKIEDGKIYCYDCGNSKNWESTSENGEPIDKSFMLTDLRTGKVIRASGGKIKNKENFVTLFNKRKYRANKNNILSAPEWLFEILEKNDKTKNMVDVIKYLLYKATGTSYGVTNSEDILNMFYPGSLTSVGGLSYPNGYNVKTDSEEGKPITPTKEQLKKALEYEANKYHSDLIKGDLDKYWKQQQSTHVNSIFGIAVAVVETSCGTDMSGQYGSGRNNMFSYGSNHNGTDRTGRDKDIELFTKGIAGSIYFGAGKYTVNEISDPYCAPPEEWAKSVNAEMTELFNAAGIEIPTLAASSDFLVVAEKVHDYVRENGYTYGGGVPPNDSGIVDCSGYVCAVLRDYGYTEIERLSSRDFCSRSEGGSFSGYPGWKVKPASEMQPGDILAQWGHVAIYIGDGKTFDCGSTEQIRKKCSDVTWHLVGVDWQYAITVSPP